MKTQDETEYQFGAISVQQRGIWISTHCAFCKKDIPSIGTRVLHKAIILRTGKHAIYLHPKCLRARIIMMSKL